MSRKPSSAISRLKQDYLRIKKDPVPYVTAEPLPSNILEWHYIVRGPESTAYSGGLYHGKLVFPTEFPYRPPSIYMLTPNGRFKVNTRLCLSISDFHPDTWNPAWSVSTILTGLLSFMLEKNPTLGSIETSDYEKKQLAIKSSEYNLKDRTFCELFPEIVEEIKRKQADVLKEEAMVRNSSSITNGLEDSLHHVLQVRPGGFLGSTLTNIVVIVGFAAFAYTVKCVLRSIAQ